MDTPESLTGQYLAGKVSVSARTTPRPLTGKWITIEDAVSHNLKSITAHFPVGVMTAIVVPASAAPASPRW